MSEKKFKNQNNYGWGLTLDMTGKVPAVNKRIFNTLEDALSFANDYNDSAIEGLQLSVIADETENNNGLYFIRKIKSSPEDTDAVLEKVGESDLNETKAIIDGYTVNNKKISENPVIDTDDLSINDSYGIVNRDYENIMPGDILTEAISKLEIALANTTLALTAAISDLDKRIGVPTKYDEDGNIVANSSGLYKLYEELNQKISGNN
jgi:hypothetical protein